MNIKRNHTQEVPLTQQALLNWKKLKEAPKKSVIWNSQTERTFILRTTKVIVEHGRILDFKIVTTQEIPGEESLRMSNLIVTGTEVGSFEGIVTQRVPRVSVSLLPEKLSREVLKR